MSFYKSLKCPLIPIDGMLLMNIFIYLAMASQNQQKPSNSLKAICIYDNLGVSESSSPNSGVTWTIYPVLDAFLDPTLILKSKKKFDKGRLSPFFIVPKWFCMGSS